MDTIIHNGTAITVNAGFDIIEDAAIGIKSGRIVYVGPASAAPTMKAAEVIDADGGLILPGLVNTHTHLPMSLFRGLADDLPLSEWLNDHIFPAEQQHINPETVKTGTLLSIAEMLLSGTTCCCDGYFYEDAVAEAVQSAGIRAVLGQGVIDYPAPGAPDPAENIEVAVEFVRKWKNRSPLISPSIFCHSIYTCSESTLTTAKRAAKAEGVLYQIHLAEVQNEATLAGLADEVSPVAYADRLGLLDDQTLIAHGVWVDDADMKIISDRKTGISHNPESNMKLASGIAPAPAQIAAGIAVGLGSDGCASNNNLDLFAEMDTAAKLHKVASKDPTVMDAKTVIRMATIEGARATGLDRIIGSIEPGKAADLIVVHVGRPHMRPLFHPESHVVYAARGADVQYAMVAGQLLVRDFRLTRMDLDAILDRAIAISAAIGKTNG